MSRPNTGPRLFIRSQSGARRYWYIRWEESGQSKRHPTGICADDRDAEARAHEYFRRWLAEGNPATLKGRRSSHPDQVKVVDVISDYVRDRHARAVKDLAEREAAITGETLQYSSRPLLFFLGDDTMASLTPARVQQYWDWRRSHSVEIVDKANGLLEEVNRATADGTIIRELSGFLRPAIKHAINERRLDPGVYYVPVPSAPPPREYWITRKEAARLLWETRRDKRARLHLPLYALIALYTGQRRRAILDLTWAQIDLVRGVIDFNPSGRKTTSKGRPKIPVPRSLLAALKRAHRRATCAHVIAYNGQPVKDIKTGFNSAAARAGIPDCTSHTLRHTAATWMANRGVSMREIGGFLGQNEVATTERYAHHHPDFMQNARRALEGHR